VRRPASAYEFWVVATRPLHENGLGFTTGACGVELGEIESLFPIQLDVPDAFARWKQLVATHDVKGKPAHDARLVAAMEIHSIDSILTFNKSDFVRYGSIKMLTPDEVLASPAAE
jgi:hypothetical protein